MMTLVLICPIIFAVSWQRVIAQPANVLLTGIETRQMKTVNFEETLK